MTTMDGTPQAQMTTQLTDVQTAPQHELPGNSSGLETGKASAPLRTLDKLNKGEQAIVAGVSPSLAFGSLDTLVTRRLWELGFLPGAVISVVGFGLLKRDPIAIKIGGTKFALRSAEAQKILVAPVPKKAAL